MAKIHTTQNETGRLMLFCPACKEGHWFNDQWSFNGDMEKPTINPSLLVTGTEWPTDEEIKIIKAGGKVEPRATRCHSFIREGKIEFLSDCTHDMAGQTVDLPDF